MILDDDHVRRALLKPDTAWRSQPELRDAAVLAPLFRRDGQDWLLYTLRREGAPEGRRDRRGGICRVVNRILDVKCIVEAAILLDAGAPPPALFPTLVGWHLFPAKRRHAGSSRMVARSL